MNIDWTQAWLTGRELRRRQFGVTWYGILTFVVVHVVTVPGSK